MPGMEIHFGNGDGNADDEPLVPVHHSWSLGRMLRSYTTDWIMVALCWGLLIFLETVGGHQRRFSLTDISIQYPFADPETVGYKMLIFISFGLPASMVLVIALAIYRSKWDAHNALLGTLTSTTMTGLVTQVVKMGVGRPRPDLIARCQPQPGSHDRPVYGLSDASICTQTDAIILKDGFKSFPSGHSSLCFAGLGFLSFYIAAKLHIISLRKTVGRTRIWVSFVPLLGATLVAISRTMDNRHHWQDVTVGSLLGLGISYVAYRAYFPPLSHPSSHLPLAPREMVTSVSPAGDEEDQRLRLDGDQDLQPLSGGGHHHQEDPDQVIPRRPSRS